MAMKLGRLLRILVWSSLFALVAFSAGSVPPIADPDDGTLQFSTWQPPANLGWVVNSALADTDPVVSNDGRSLYFTAPLAGGYGGADIWVCQRASFDEPWGTPQNVGPTINTTANETNPFLSHDGHRLYFLSNRSGGAGGVDVYVSRRHNKRDDFGWRLPENLGTNVNTSANETQPTVYEDDASGAINLYFASNRPGGLGGDDIYMSSLQADETFGPPAVVLELSSASEERKVTIRRDGLEMFMLSNRPGSILNLQGAPSFDIWTATRATTADPWSSPVNADPAGLLGINSNRHDGGPWLDFSGTTLYFHAAQRTGNNGFTAFDLWMTTRNKVKQPE